MKKMKNASPVARIAQVGPALVMTFGAMTFGACAAPSEPVEGVEAAGAEQGNAQSGGAAAVDTNTRDGDVIDERTSAPEIARLTLAKGHELRFVDLDGTVLVSESRSPSMPSALTVLGEAGVDAEHATARDLFEALAPPGTAIPEGLSKLETRLTQPMGWGLAKADFGSTTLSGGNNACNNTSFQASTYGGILPTNDAWLDRHPSEAYDQFLYDYQDGILRKKCSTRYLFELKRGNVLQFRGKGCLEVKEGAGSRSIATGTTSRTSGST